MHPDQRTTWRSMEVPPDILATQLGKEITQIITSLRPALLVYDITQEHTSFFLDHHEDLRIILAFIKKGYDGSDPEGYLDPHTRWYTRELREDLKNIVQSGSLTRGWASHFAIHNRLAPSRSIDPRHWSPKTIAFIENLRPRIAQIIKERYIDHWLQTPIDILGDLTPIQVIQYGEGQRILALLETMETE